MTPSQAARVIGCSTQQVRTLIRSGKIKARKRKAEFGYYYDITQEEAERYRDEKPDRGWPRGKARKPLQEEA